MTYLKQIVTPCLIILLMSCAVQNKEQPKIKQGIYGNVTWLERNMMPSPDERKRSNGQAIERSVYIYEVTTLNETIGQAPLFTSIKTKFVKKIKTNKVGYFESELLPGIYSVFTKEPEGGFFANTFNRKGEISLVEIKPFAVSRLDININYKAAY